MKSMVKGIAPSCKKMPATTENLSEKVLFDPPSPIKTNMKEKTCKSQRKVKKLTLHMVYYRNTNFTKCSRNMYMLLFRV
jgi:hypothetical protein